MQPRVAIFHYHLFKNAGTSFDRVLKANFSKGWVTSEFPWAANNTRLVEAWIAANPTAVAYSTHTASGPIPAVAGVTLVPVLFLRDPLERIASAYRFERKQQADTWGAQLAKIHGFEGYVRARLGVANDRQCRNFQTARLASLVPGPGPELDRALAAMELIRTQGVLGLVARFDEALAALAERIRPDYPTFAWTSTRANVSEGSDGEAPSADLRQMLEAVNTDDRALLAAAEAGRVAAT